MNTNIENAKAQMRKGVLELCILSIIAEKEAYPSDIIQRLKDADLLVVEGTLYPLLTRLKESGALEYRWIESDKGPPRKYYQLTDLGRLTLSDMQTAWDELVASVAKITVGNTNLVLKKEDPNDHFLVQETLENIISINADDENSTSV
jgi:PadR family transcriptional regulator, regulatory protein PadR